MSDALLTLPAIWSAAWDLLERGATDRTAPSRFPVLATVGQAGGGEARMVVLRRACRAALELEVHTDRASAKLGELRAEPRATLLVWDPAQALQLRLKVKVTARPGTPADWDILPHPMRAAYGGTPPSGTPLEQPEDWQPAPDPGRFAILTARLRMLETLQLCPDRHRRARFAAPDRWAGGWLAP